jgi:type III pantothenate kinase
MLLAIDIGNTDIVYGVHTRQGWAHIWRKPSTQTHQLVDLEMHLRSCFLENGLKISDPWDIIISSVVPDLTPIMVEMIQLLFGREPILAGPDTYSEVTLEIERAHEIGSDLVANAVAAYYRTKGACIVVDFGTALTFTTVSTQGQVLGVAIAPGLKTAIKALAGNTARLPEVPLELPSSVIGTNTVHAIQAGILIGYTGLVREVIRQIKEEIGPCKVIATGGLSYILSPLHNEFTEVDPLLTLEGLRILARNFRLGK